MELNDVLFSVLLLKVPSSISFINYLPFFVGFEGQSAINRIEPQL